MASSTLVFPLPFAPKTTFNPGAGRTLTSTRFRTFEIVSRLIVMRQPEPLDNARAQPCGMSYENPGKQVHIQTPFQQPYNRIGMTTYLPPPCSVPWIRQLLFAPVNPISTVSDPMADNASTRYVTLNPISSSPPW